MTPSFDNICSSIKKCLCQSSPVWALPVHDIHGNGGEMLSSSHEVSETLGCHNNTQGSNFLSRQNKYYIQSPHSLSEKDLFVRFMFFSEIGEKHREISQ